MKRYLVSEAPETGSGFLVGRKNGYKRVEDALGLARQMFAQHGQTYVVELYEFSGDNRDHLDTVEYVGRETYTIVRNPVARGGFQAVRK